MDEDIALLTRAIADEESLLNFSTTAARRFPADRAVLNGVVALQRLHVSRLRASLSNLHPPVTRTSARVPRHIDDLKTALAAVEAQEHRDRAANCLAATSGLLAQLFASIAASHAVTVTMLTPDAAPTAVVTPRSVTNPAALQPALEAEYAAVFGYGVVGGVLTAGVTHSDAADDARSSYDVHRGRRDTLRALITAAGAQPAAAEPAYDLPFPVTGEPSAARLARYLEARCAAVYARAVATTVGDTRAARQHHAGGLRHPWSRLGRRTHRLPWPRPGVTRLFRHGSSSIESPNSCHRYRSTTTAR